MNSKADEKLTAARRVKKRREYLHIQNRGKKYRAEHLLLSVWSLPETAKDSRIGVTVTKKVDKRAVNRNRIKRQIKEYLRKQRRFFSYPVDLVVITLNGACELNYDQVCQQLEFLLKKSALIRKVGKS